MPVALEASQSDISTSLKERRAGLEREVLLEDKEKSMERCNRALEDNEGAMLRCARLGPMLLGC